MSEITENNSIGWLQNHRLATFALLLTPCATMLLLFMLIRLRDYGMSNFIFGLALTFYFLINFLIYALLIYKLLNTKKQIFSNTIPAIILGAVGFWFVFGLQSYFNGDSIGLILQVGGLFA